jgi:hypothetical protein
MRLPQGWQVAWWVAATFFAVTGALLVVFFTRIGGVAIGVTSAVLFAPLVALPVRSARLRVEFIADEVIVHQQLRTWRIPVVEIAAVSSGRSSNPFGLGTTVHLELRDGRTIRVDALASFSTGATSSAIEQRRRRVENLVALHTPAGGTHRAH